MASRWPGRKSVSPKRRSPASRSSDEDIGARDSTTPAANGRGRARPCRAWRCSPTGVASRPMTLAASYPYYLANIATAPNQDLVVTDKYSGKEATRVARADATAIDRAIGLAVQACGPMAALRPYERQA